MNTPQVSPRQTSQKYSNELNLMRDLGERRRGGDQHDGAENPADRREHHARAERELPLPLRVMA